MQKTLPLQFKGPCEGITEFPPCPRCAALDETKVAFLAGLSHELITPLNAILGAAQLLRLNTASVAPTAEEEDQNDLIQIIEDSGQLLSSALGDIMNFSTISQNISLDLRPVDVRDLIESCVEQCSRDIVRKDLAVTYTVSSSVAVMADPERMRQVLLNLLKNACKFNRHGGDVHVRTEVSGASLSISVRDSGVGMDGAVAERISETNFFYQGDNSRTKRFGGIGLGLAITCKLVKVMGGSLDIESDKQGTLVTVCVPVRHHHHHHHPVRDDGLKEGKDENRGDGNGHHRHGSFASVVEANEANGSSRETSLWGTSTMSTGRSSCDDSLGDAGGSGDVLTGGASFVLDIDHADLASQVKNMLELNGDVVVTRDDADAQFAEVMITSSKQSLRNRSGRETHLPIIFLARPSGRLATSVLPIDCTQVTLPLTNLGLLRAVGERRAASYPPLPRISSDSWLSNRSSLFGSGGIRASGSSARDSSARNSIDNSQLPPPVMHTSFYKRSSACRGQHQSTADLLSKASVLEEPFDERDGASTSRSVSATPGDRLPCQPGHQTHPGHPPRNQHAVLQILVAEDNDINIKICTKILEHVGGKETRIDVVHTGRQVLSALELNPTYDLVLMDIHMPDMDGIEAAKELRRRGIQCPVVALSADSTVHDECLAAGMRAFLRKPLKVTDVTDLLKSLKKGRGD